MGEHKSEPTQVSRRNFLKLAGIGSGAGAVLLVTDAEKAAAAENAEAPRKSGYVESAHVRAYYASTRF